MEKDAAGYPQGHTNPGTSRTSPAAYPTSRAVLRGGGDGDATSLPGAWVGDHPGLPGPMPRTPMPRNGSSSVALSRNVGPAGDGRSVGNNRPELDGVRSSVRSGRPYGAEDWVEVISHRLGIVGEPHRRGRPPREKML